MGWPVSSFSFDRHILTLDLEWSIPTLGLNWPVSTFNLTCFISTFNLNQLILGLARLVLTFSLKWPAWPLTRCKPSRPSTRAISSQNLSWSTRLDICLRPTCLDLCSGKPISIFYPGQLDKTFLQAWSV